MNSDPYPWPRWRLESPPGEELARIEPARARIAHARALPGGCLECLVVLGMLGILAALLLPAQVDARKRSKVTDCKSNLKQLGLYLSTYVSRYGGDVLYPTDAAPLGIPTSPAAVPATRGARFWAHLYCNPSGANAVWMRPGEDGLAKCKVYGGNVTATCFDWCGPDFRCLSAFPGGKLSDRTPANVYISGDLLGSEIAHESANHGSDENGPNYDFNGLRFDGSVQTIAPTGAGPPGGEHAKFVQTLLEDEPRTP